MVDMKKKAITNANIEVVQLTKELNTMSNRINTKNHRVDRRHVSYAKIFRYKEL
jgi:hypothetical protein